MTERRQSALSRSSDYLQIGPSSLAWEGEDLVIRFQEIGAPLPFSVQGEVRLTPTCQTPTPVQLDRAGHHLWWPLSPKARVEVKCTNPDTQWSGTGYLDTNAGDESLESRFESWDWSRAGFNDGSAVLYNVAEKGHAEQPLALWIDSEGQLHEFDAPERQQLPRSFWRVPRGTRTDAGAKVRLVRALEDTPFYTRSVIETSMLGRPCVAIHESLSLERFSSPIVKAMLPFRMPRAFWR